MNRHPFNSGELGRDDPELTSLAEELEGLASGDPQPSAGFHDRVLAAIQAEPARRRSWLARLVAGDGRHLLQAASLAVVLVIGVAAALAAGGILDGLRRVPGTGPTLLPSPSTVTQTITPSPSPSVSPSPSPSASPSSSGTAEPSGSDDHGTETPRPSESDNSGPGGGGDASDSPRASESDNSGPGGDDD